MAPNCVLYGRILEHGQCQKSFDSMDTGRGKSNTIISVFVCKNHVRSARLGEENERIKKVGVPPKPVSKQYKSDAEANDGQHVGLSDDEGSIVAQPSKTPSCGACRIRESKVWWKAPKGLPTNVLCENCGTNWRKYADLNVRPVREESLPSAKAKLSDKREGTPLSGPSAKRPRVCYGMFLDFLHAHRSYYRQVLLLNRHHLRISPLFLNFAALLV